MRKIFKNNSNFKTCSLFTDSLQIDTTDFRGPGVNSVFVFQEHKR